ncbi:hypothetical protein VTO73DRAFT_3990 [Trametes versicolor]
MSAAPSSRSSPSSTGTPARLPSTRATSPPSSPPAIEEAEDDEKAVEQDLFSVEAEIQSEEDDVRTPHAPNPQRGLTPN